MHVQERVLSAECFKGVRKQEVFVFKLLFKFLNSTPASPEATVTLARLLRFDVFETRRAHNTPCFGRKMHLFFV